MNASASHTGIGPALKRRALARVERRIAVIKLEKLLSREILRAHVGILCPYGIVAHDPDKKMPAA